jgi:hypothetical protein
MLTTSLFQYHHAVAWNVAVINGSGSRGMDCQEELR